MKIALITMPFADTRLPSIALTQLRSVLKTRYPDRVQTDIHYVNHDFAVFFGQDLYQDVSTTLSYSIPGLGDVMFSHIAFPGKKDMTEAHARKSTLIYRENQKTVDFLLSKKPELESFLQGLIDTYALDGYDVVGFTSMFVQTVPSIAMARLLKERRPDMITLIGGANCETPMGQVLAKNVDSLDFVFSGPALQTFPDFIGHLLDGEEQKCHEIPGIFSAAKIEAHGEQKEIGPELPIEVDVPLEYDDYLDSLAAKDLDESEIGLTFETSRGCWWGERSHCTFCGLNGMSMKYRSMQPDRALELMQGLFDRYYPRVRLYQSVDNIMPREYLTEVWPKLETPPDAALFYEVKADLKDHEMEVLAKSGVTLLQPGIEALSTPVLKLMGKGISALQNVRFLKGCLTHGIEPQWNLLIGFPGEEEEVYEKYMRDLPDLVHLPPPNGPGTIRFDRYSPYFNQAKQYGLRLKPFDFYTAAYPFDKADLMNLAYYFVDVAPGSYKKLRNKWRRQLREPVSNWRRQWKRGQNVIPLLQYGVNGDVIHDTRSGEAVEHVLESEPLSLLRRLDQPAKMPVAARSLGWTREQAEEHLGPLVEKRLVIEDRGIYLSLVVSSLSPFWTTSIAA